MNCYPTLLSCFPQLFLKCGSKSSTGAKVKGHKRCLWSERSTGAKVPLNESSLNICSWGAKVPGVRKFHGPKVLGLFAPQERFYGPKVPRERKFCLWTFRSQERKCRGTKRPDTVCGRASSKVTACIRRPRYGSASE